MRLKIRLDCTGEPPGELTIIATVGSFESENAFSIAPATELKARPGRKGVAMPIGPEKRSTGTTGPRLKKRIGCSCVWSGALGYFPSLTIKVRGCLNSRPGIAAAQRQGGAVAQDRIDLGPKPLVLVVQNQARTQFQAGPAAFDSPHQDPGGRFALARMDGQQEHVAEAP